MLMIIDKILQGNLFTQAVAFAATKVGFVNLNFISLSTSRDEVYQNALFISAVTAAIYGVYRVGKLLYDGIKLINKKIKK